MKWKFVEPSSIVKNSISLNELERDAGFVYFLIENNEIVYVGQTTSIHHRIAEHKRNKGKVFSRVNWIKVGSGYLDIVESYYILLLRPKYNKHMGNASWIEKQAENYGLPKLPALNTMPFRGREQYISAKMIFRHAQQKGVKISIARKWVELFGANLQEWTVFVSWLRKKYRPVKMGAHEPSVILEYVESINRFGELEFRRLNIKANVPNEVSRRARELTSEKVP